MPPTATVATAAEEPARKPRCRYLQRGLAGQCTAEAISDKDGDPRICLHHAAEIANLLAPGLLAVMAATVGIR